MITEFACQNSLDSVWNWLAVVHHYGLPTRLLDWTYSPYVALHFATECLDTFTDDAIVWCVNYAKTNQLPQTYYKKSSRRKGQWYLPQTC